MAKKELDLIIRARNATTAGLAAAGKSIAGFARGVFGVGKAVTVGLGAAFAAVGAFALKALSVWSEQEKATRSLSSALAAAGDDYAALVPKLSAAASAIQDETGAADEATLAGMARMRMLGVQADKLEEAARATIALKAVGMEDAAAQKVVAMAMQGHYEMLQRYVPALRNAKDETEKARIVNDLFARGYAQQRALLNTVSGAWAAFKGRIGDVWEEFGRATDRAGGISAALHRAGDAVKAFGQRVAEWVDSEKFAALQTSIQGVVAAMGSGEGRAEIKEIMAGVSEYIYAAFVDGADYVYEKIRSAFGNTMVGRAWGATGGKVWSQVTRPLLEKWGGVLKSAYGGIGNLLALRQKTVGKVEGKAYEALAKAMGLRDKEKPEEPAGKSRREIASEKLSAAFDQFTKKYAPEGFVGPPEPPLTTAVDPENGDDADTGDVKANLSGLKKLFLQWLKGRADAIAEAKKAIEDLEAEETAVIKDELQERWQAQQEAAERELELAKELAGKKVKEFIAEAREKKKADKQAENEAERDADRIKMLEDRRKRGGKLSRQQQEWLEAAKAIQAAKGAIKPLEDQIAIAKENLKEMQKSSRELANIRVDLAAHNAKLDELMRFQ